MRGHDHDFQPVDLLKLKGFGICCTGHTRKLFIEPEIILKCGRGQRLALILYRQTFLGLNSLMYAIRPAASWHSATRMLIDDDNLTARDHVVIISVIQVVGLQCCMHMMK